MNYVLQLHGERIVYPVPPGLQELMSDISREVLRDQPRQVYRYIANLLETMVNVRKYSRVAGQLVDEVIGENSELLAYIQSLGLTWEEANSSARKIQGAFRLLKCRKDLRRKVEAKKEKAHVKTLLHSSVSFQDYLRSMNIDLESLSRDSSQLVDVYKDFKAEQEKGEGASHKHASTHTIETFQPKIPYLRKARDSKLLTYLESPSVESFWSKTSSVLSKDRLIKKDPTFSDIAITEFVYEQEPHQTESYLKSSLLSNMNKLSSASSISTVTENELGLPSYHKTKLQIPMISKSGELTKGNKEDTVTLHSLPSQAEDQTSLRHVRLSSLMTLEDKQENDENPVEVIEGITDSDIRMSAELTEQEKEVEDSVTAPMANRSSISAAKRSRSSIVHQSKSSVNESLRNNVPDSQNI